MNRHIARIASTATRRRHWRPLSRLSERIHALSAGDKLIAGVLGLVVVIVSVSGIYAFEHSLLVRVPAYGGTLTEGEVGSPRYINPLLAITDADRDLSALTYAGLMGLSGKGKLVPVLAKTYTISPDGKTYTFTLRKDARFSDGSPVTANDVVFTVHKAQDQAIKSPQYANWSGVTVKAIDTHTVQFTLQKPYAPFLENTTLGILPAHLWQNIPDAQFPFTRLVDEPVGAGPFKVTRIVRDSNGLITEYDLSASNNYVLGRPYLNGIHIKFYPGQEELSSALHSGAIQSAYGVATPGALTAPYSSVFGVFFNADQNPVFTHKDVRKALSLAINRDNIVKNVLHGYATALMGPIPPGSGVTQTPVPHEANPTAAAAQILESNGWTYDGNAREWKNAKQNLTLSSLTIKTSNAPQLKAVATAVRSDWEKLGIDVQIELYEPGDLSQNVIRPRKYEALLFGMVIGRNQDLFAFWHSSQRNDPGLNIALYANKTVDALLEDARTTSDPKQHLSDLNKIEQDVSADYPAAFTHTPMFIYSIPQDLHGVQLPQIATPSDRFADVQNWYMQTDEVWPFLAPRKS